MGLTTILIVEDDVVVRNLMVTSLVRADYSVLEADDAVEALAVSGTFEGTIHLLIADHALKTMTGREVAEKITQSRCDLKVLHVSGYPLSMLQQKGETISAADFLAKPFLPKQLVAKVREILTTVVKVNPSGYRH